MATVRMTMDEVLDDELPKTCLQCGGMADQWVTKKFSWHPPWVWVLLLGGLLPLIIVAVITTKSATLRAPLCNQHRNHWSKRTLFHVIGLLSLVGLIIGLIAVSGGTRPTRDLWMPILGIGLAVVFASWFIGAIVFAATAIRPGEITSDELVLKGVSEQFVADFDAMVEEAEQRRLERRRQRRLQRERDRELEYDRSPERRRPDDETFRER